MKLLIAFATFFAINASAASLQFYTIDTDIPISAGDLRARCEQDHAAAKNKLPSIAAALGITPDTFNVTGYYGAAQRNVGGGNTPIYRLEYYCMLDFRSSDRSVRMQRGTVTQLTHLEASEWGTACKPALQEATANALSPISIMWTGWTLIQKRICGVDTVLFSKR
ncbi:MAG: hypothetical protein JST80_10590 [Bdellovibrionales bacterium]|nr:hypothetical protein [Bdellovibrionales bacterium]